MKITSDEMRVFAQYIQTLCGVYLDASKAYLVETRLSTLAEGAGCSTFSEFFYKAKSDISKNLPRQIIDAITTNETLFFRDSTPFDLLQHKIIPELIDHRKKTNPPGRPIPIRVWSAACSTGQEIYSIAITLKELLGNLSQYNIRLLGTDISNRAVAQASRGIYNRVEMERGLPQDKLTRYFTLQDGTNWKISDEIRSMAVFKTANLLEDFSILGKFDIIFCRNVAIYFTDQDKSNLFRRMAKALEPDGYLIIGSTESLIGYCPDFESQRHLRSVYYQLKTG
jgi:chemotaxis protein methyltransferase CheR